MSTASIVFSSIVLNVQSILGRKKSFETGFYIYNSGSFSPYPARGQIFTNAPPNTPVVADGSKSVFVLKARFVCTTNGVLLDVMSAFQQPTRVVPDHATMLSALGRVTAFEGRRASIEITAYSPLIPGKATFTVEADIPDTSKFKYFIVILLPASHTDQLSFL